MNLLWKVLAAVISRPLIANWIISRAQRTPYSPIMSRDGPALYMDRWWVLNPYGKDAAGQTLPAKHQWLPSIRVHHICLPDDDQHEHDHPWDARTIILRGWYLEERRSLGLPAREMEAGMTAAICAGDYHRITRVSEGGVYTLFFTWRNVEDWGFNVDGQKVNWRQYLGIDQP